MLWTDAERGACEEMFALWNSEWKQHLHSYPALAGRSIDSVAARIKNFIRPASTVSSKPRVVQGFWPQHGVVLFDDDPRAIDDHGSFGTISRAINYSPCGTSAAWAVRAA